MGHITRVHLNKATRVTVPYLGEAALSHQLSWDGRDRQDLGRQELSSSGMAQTGLIIIAPLSSSPATVKETEQVFVEAQTSFVKSCSPPSRRNGVFVPSPQIFQQGLLPSCCCPGWAEEPRSPQGETPEL